MKYVYATIYSVAALFIMILVVTGNPYQTSLSVLGVLEILVVSATVFVGTVLVMTWLANQAPNTTVTNFRVSRALRIEGLKTKDVHHYFELQDGGILFLSANQELDVYALPEGYGDGPLFPNSDFSLLRNVTTTEIFGLAINGKALQAEELVAPNEEAYLGNLFIKNGEVAQGISYEEVKQRILSDR